MSSQRTLTDLDKFNNLLVELGETLKNPIAFYVAFVKMLEPEPVRLSEEETDAVRQAVDEYLSLREDNSVTTLKDAMKAAGMDSKHPAYRTTLYKVTNFIDENKLFQRRSAEPEGWLKLPATGSAD